MAFRYTRLCLAKFGMLGLGGLLVAGCVVYTEAILDLHRAREAIATARQYGAAERSPREFARLERRYAQVRETFYTGEEEKAAKMAQELASDAITLATERREVLQPPPTPNLVSEQSNRPPHAQLTAPPKGEVQTPLLFDASASFDPNGDRLTYLWDFGDASPPWSSTLPSTTHQYAKPGSYTVKLAVIDDRGGSDTATVTVAVRRQVVIHYDKPRAQEGKGLVSPEAEQKLLEVVQEMRADAALRVQVVAHTDATGSASDNTRLSQQQAEGVRSYLAAHGIAEDRIRLAWKGATQPIATNATAGGQAQNRRVEITLYPMQIAGVVTIPMHGQNAATDLYFITRDKNFFYLPSIVQARPVTMESPDRGLTIYSIPLETVFPPKSSSKLAAGVFGSEPMNPLLSDYVRISVPTLRYVRTFPGTVFPRLVHGRSFRLGVKAPESMKQKVEEELQAGKMRVTFEFLYGQRLERTGEVKVAQKDFLNLLQPIDQRTNLFRGEDIAQLIQFFIEDNTLEIQELEFKIFNIKSSEDIIREWFQIANKFNDEKSSKQNITILYQSQENPAQRELVFAGFSYADFENRILASLVVGFNHPPRSPRLQDAWVPIPPDVPITLRAPGHCGLGKGVKLPQAVEPGQRISISVTTPEATPIPEHAVHVEVLNKVYSFDDPVVLIEDDQPTIFLDVEGCEKLSGSIGIRVTISE